MASIKRLSENVRSTVRSGVIVFDMARVVEELVYNSLDAGAKNVSVYVGVGSCCVKVVDDGSGITRDGLVLLGEKYTTSKLNYLEDMDVVTGTFGFRGEALGSISDVSVLEIVTKAHGRPNGYRKVLKGCKCLYLGIDDDKQDVGTTVTVRNLFYNQPVKRKHMLTSPKKVLYSIRKCVLYTALVHSKASFKVVDTESEDTLLSTQPSSIPLPLLASSFGIEISSTLYELSMSDGLLEISGYMSCPYETASVKVLQCVYINARYVSNCHINKLLNELAIRFMCLDSLKGHTCESNGKRSRFPAYTNYLLNLSCPHSQYDLCFEPSKTSVEFKDWNPILKFIERVVTQFWSQKKAYGNFLSHPDDTPDKDEMWEDCGKTEHPAEATLVKSKIAKKVCRMKDQHDSHDNPFPPMEMLSQDGRHSLDKIDSGPIQNLYRNSAEFERQQTDTRGTLTNSKMARKVCRMNDQHDSHKDPFPPMEIQSPDGRHSLDKIDSRPIQNLHQNSAEFKRQQTDTRGTPRMQSSYKSWDRLVSKCASTVNEESHQDYLTVDKNIGCSEYNFLRNNHTATENFEDHVNDSFFGSTWEEGFPKVDLSISRGSTRTKLQYNCFELTNDAEEISKDYGKPFLQSCSIKESLPPGKALFTREGMLEFQNESFRTKRKQCDPDYNIDYVEIDDSDHSVGISPGDLWKELAVSACPSLKLRSISDLSRDADDSSQYFFKSTTFGEECFVEESDVTPILGHHSLKSEWQPLTPDPLLGGTSWDVEHSVHEMALEWDSRSSKGMYGDFANREDINCKLNYDSIRDGADKGHSGHKRDVLTCLQRHNFDDKVSPRCSDIFSKDTDWLFFYSPIKDYSGNCAASHKIRAYDHFANIENRNEMHQQHDYGKCRRYKRISRRSHSAPPFYRRKQAFALRYHIPIGAKKLDAEIFLEASTNPENCETENMQRTSGACSKPGSEKDMMFDVRPVIKTIPDSMHDKNDIKKREKFLKSPHSSDVTGLTKDFIHIPTEEHTHSEIKWQNNRLHVSDGNNSHNVENQHNILDISSGILHLASDSLVPEINKKCLEDTKVLQQVGKKFIPVVASGTLVIIDQHAADERIKLEELRQKVLSGQMKTITYLDCVQELVLPEIGYQLLQNYAEQIQKWGWICNIHAQGLKSFAKNMDLLHKRPAAVTLLAVPCILGVNLSDIDLLEFLQQLADTDGSSIMPPSVLRLLNSKACRGAIMFGDSLLPSECSLIVEELKQTSLCFQCAHGRPTTVPLVDLKVLHKQITKLGLLNDEPDESWHGLRRQEFSFERATKRLKAAI